MEKNIKTEVVNRAIEDVVLYGEFSIDEMPNVSEDWMIAIRYFELVETDEVDEVTLNWVENPYKVISEVQEKNIEFISLHESEYDEDGKRIGERICHPVRIRWKKNILTHRHLLKELVTNTNIDIRNQEVNFTYEKWYRNSLEQPIKKTKF